MLAQVKDDNAVRHKKDRKDESVLRLTDYIYFSFQTPGRFFNGSPVLPVEKAIASSGSMSQMLMLDSAL